jgi:hypothetical protein
MKEFRINLTTDQGELICQWSVAIFTAEERDQGLYDQALEESDYNSILVQGEINPTDFDYREDGVGADILWEIDHHINGNGQV